MRRFLRRKGSQLVDPPAEPEPELPCIVEAVEKLAAEIEGTQDILGKLQRACEEEQQNADCPLAAPSEPKPPGTTAFHIGQHVIVRGLQTATEHNGKVGEIESFSPARGRWIVRFDDNTTVALRAERLHAATMADLKQQAAVKEAKDRAARLRAERQAVHERQAHWEESEKRDARRRQAAAQAQAAHAAAQKQLDEIKAVERDEVPQPTAEQGSTSVQIGKPDTTDLSKCHTSATDGNESALQNSVYVRDEASAAVILQRVARGRAARHAVRRLAASRNHAATVIQHAFRHRQAVIKEATETAVAESSAAVTLQRVARGRAARHAVRRLAASWSHAATVIQHAFRHRWALAATAARRRRLLVAEAAAEFVVVAIIDELATAELLQKRLKNTAVAAATRFTAGIIQAAAASAAERAQKDRASAVELQAERLAAVTLQRVARGRAARHAVRRLAASRNHAASVIQHAFCHRQAVIKEATETAVAEGSAAVTLQRVARGRAARHAVRRLAASRSHAATVIQHAFRHRLVVIEEAIEQEAAQVSHEAEAEEQMQYAGVIAKTLPQDTCERLAAAADAALLKEKQATAAAELAAQQVAAAAALHDERRIAATVAAQTLVQKEQQRLAATAAAKSATERAKLVATGMAGATTVQNEKNLACKKAAKHEIASGTETLQAETDDRTNDAQASPLEVENQDDSAAASHIPPQQAQAAILRKPTPPTTARSGATTPSVRLRAHSKNPGKALVSNKSSPEHVSNGLESEFQADVGWKCGVGLDLVLDSSSIPSSPARAVDNRRETNSEAVRLLMSGITKQPGAATPKTMGLEAAVQAAASRPTPRPQPQPLPPPKPSTKAASCTATTASGPSKPLLGPRWEKLPAQVVESATALRPAKLGFKKRGVKLRATKVKSTPRLATPQSLASPSAPDTPTAILQGGLQDTIPMGSKDDSRPARSVNWERPEKEGELDFVRQVLRQTTSNPALVLGSARTAATQAQRHLRDFERTFKGMPQSAQSARPAVRLQGHHTVLQQRHLMQHQRAGTVA